MMKRIIFLCLMACMMAGKADAQVLIPMDNGLPYKVRCSTFDSLGNFYAVTGELQDSIRVYKWDNSNRKWSRFATMFGTFRPFEGNKASCHFLYGDLIITGIRISAPDHSYILRYRNSNASWTQIARVSHGWYQTEWGDLISHKLNNRIIIAGHMDSLNGVPNPGIMSYDGSNFTKLNNPGMYFWGPTFVSRNDSLYINSSTEIWSYIGSNWSRLYKSASYKMIYGMTMQGSDIIIAEAQQIKRMRNGICIDSFQSPWVRPMPTAVGNRILVSPKDWNAGWNKDLQTVYSLSPGLDATAVFRNQVVDSGTLNFARFGNKMYVYGNEGIKFNSSNYNWIAELLIDSIKDIAIDTVLVRTYRDQNKNDVFDGSEYGAPSVLKELNSGITYSSDGSGRVILYPLDNEDIRVQFENEKILDTCYRPPFTGGRSAGTYNSPVTRDTIDLPIWRTNLQNRNVKLYTYGESVARLANPGYMYIQMHNVDCDAQTANVTLTVKLDPNTVLLASNPAYTSKNGNVLTYNLSIGAYSVSDLQLKIEYPNTLYSIGQTAVHSARVSTGFSEDTTDNTDTFRQKMVYSYDPNAKYCYPEGRVRKEVNKIRYTVEFQNEGNDDAWRVTIVDTLNMKIPVVYFQMVGASHPYTVSNRDNVVTWVFDNIKLRPKSVDEAGSKGFLVFDATLNTGLRIGDSITNKAHIYFDLNEPIHTNMAFLMRTDKPDLINEVNANANLNIYPNPGNDRIYAENLSAYDQVISIYNAIGELVMTIDIAANSTVIINPDALSRGIYLFRTAQGTCIKYIRQ